MGHVFIFFPPSLLSLFLFSHFTPFLFIPSLSPLSSFSSRSRGLENAVKSSLAEVWGTAPATKAFLCSLNSDVAINKNNFPSLPDTIVYNRQTNEMCEIKLKRAENMVPTTLKNSFSRTFQDKMNRFPWLICSCEVPMSVFTCLQSH